MNQHVRGADGNSYDGDGTQGRHWACPFYLSNPIRHAACVAYKLARVPDVRQHIERKHADEAGEEVMAEMKSKSGRGRTNPERWYSLWNLFFPGRVRPTSPYYTGTEFVDLSVALMSRFMEERNMDGIMSADVKGVLMGYVAFVKTASREMKAGRMSIQQSLTRLPDPPGPMILGPPQQPDARGLASEHHSIRMSNIIVPPQPQASSMPAADSRYRPGLTDTAAYAAVSAHQLPHVLSLDATATNRLAVSSNLSDAINWDSAGGSEHGGAVEQFDFGYHYPGYRNGIFFGAGSLAD